MQEEHLLPWGCIVAVFLLESWLGLGPQSFQLICSTLSFLTDEKKHADTLAQNAAIVFSTGS